MKMSELMLAVGDENIRFQNLQHDASIAQTKHGVKVTFYTDAINPIDWLHPRNSKTVGLVVWLPKDRVDAALAARKQES